MIIDFKQKERITKFLSTHIPKSIISSLIIVTDQIMCLDMYTTNQSIDLGIKTIHSTMKYLSFCIYSI